MGMSKEQLKEMIDNVIVSNGKGQITADVLNLVLNNIAENAGGGGGFMQVYECYRDGFSGGWGPSEGYHGDDEKRRQNNIEVYNKIYNEVQKIWDNLDNDEDINLETQKNYVQNTIIGCFWDRVLYDNYEYGLECSTLYRLYDTENYIRRDENGNDLHAFLFYKIDGSMPMLFLCEDGSVLLEVAG